MKQRVAAIEEKMAGPTFWNNQEQAQATVAELKEIRTLEKPLDEAISAAADIQVMIDMAEEDASFAGELPRELAASRP